MNIDRPFKNVKSKLCLTCVRQTDHREQETYIGHRIYLYHGSNGCSSWENMHIFFKVICGIGASIVDIVQ